MSRGARDLGDLSRAVLSQIQARRGGNDPFVVAIDGRSGSGKSSISERTVQRLDAVLIQTDDFFAADISSQGWRARSPAERARDCIDWKRLRGEALEPLLAGNPAVWHRFDFDAGPLSDGTYPMRREACWVEPLPIVVLDGAYSSRDELSDVLDLTVLVEAPEEIRRARLAAREDPEFVAEWYRLWDDAEDYYFNELRPPRSFDLVISNG